MSGAPRIAIVLGVFAGWLSCGGAVRADTAPMKWREAGKLLDHPTYLVYLPDGLESGKKYPLVFALSPVADALGMMHASFFTPNYPEGKIAVFLASPTDFRYGEMKRDRSFLEQHHWKIDWIEFAGGHRLAPAAAYEQAAGWLEENLR